MEKEGIRIDWFFRAIYLGTSERIAYKNAENREK